ncbi:MAG: DUF6049 family protein [Gordonia sp. (in: high G+C Gram-positive bacteria)]|uniref:DUF6049 family protein n=1 Tax=Gordonia sp. (in: high G+C Gram-positive bacteria) TaxID=84139 RepID=UPI0039E4F120
MTADARHPRPILVLVGVLLLVAGLLPLTAGTARAADPGYADLTVDEITPSMVTSAAGTVHVRGTVTNTFDRPISGLRVQLRRGDAIKAATDLRTSLMAPVSAFTVESPGTALTSSLAAGGSTDFDLEVPVNGTDGLRIDDTGVYPLMVSAVGDPESGGPVQVAESRTLLPVMSLPADPARAASFSGDPRIGRDGELGPDTSEPAILTMLWPLAASPQLAPGVLGGGTEPLRLISDQLAGSLKPDGRLGGQLEALKAALAGDDAESRLRRSLCLAIDPDLLVTVEGMTHGYVVAQNPADPQSPTSPGTGQAAATAWLTGLRQIAPKTCVVALPYAQAGLDSLHVINDPTLASSALNDPSDIVDQVLNIQSVRGFTVPAVGTLTEQGRDVMVAAGSTTAAVAASAVDPAGRTTTGRYKSGSASLQTYDMPVSAALGAVGGRPVIPAIVPSWQQPQLNTESAVSRRQSAVAALAFPALTPTDPSAQAPVTGRSAFVMPPTYWSPSKDDAAALLSAAGTLLGSDAAVELPLADLAAHLSSTDTDTRLVTPGDIDPVVAEGFPISSSNAETMRQQVALAGQLQSSLVGHKDTTITTPQTYLQPLRQDLLRAAATPAESSLDAARTARAGRIASVSSTLSRMKQSVSLLDPGGRYTLASERSPLLLIVRNELALPIRVQLGIDAPEALHVGDVGTVEIPPIGTRQLQIPTHATTSERATVKIALKTSTGVSLNDPIELSVFSNRYGRPLFWITIGAAIVLVLLTARRLWHRFRGEPDSADADRPEPDDRERELASASYQQRLEVTREEQAEPRDAEEGKDA